MSVFVTSFITCTETLDRPDDEAHPNGLVSNSESPISTSTSTHLHSIAEDDDENDTLSQGMSLLLTARERILTLSEQRVRTQHPSNNHPS